MRELEFQHGGIWYRCSLEKEFMGHIIQSGGMTWDLPHSSWKIVGFAFHHWNNHATLKVESIKNGAECFKGLVFDNDHGTMRQWRSNYAGRLARVTHAGIMNY